MLADSAAFDTKIEDMDMDMTASNSVVIKEEKSDGMLTAQFSTDPDDDDVVVLPSEDPIVTEILDETEAEKTVESEFNVTDDDVMIQEPKIETQLVPDDDDDEPKREHSEQNLIVKIKEEPKDDGYEDLVNEEEEDAFVEVTAIANDAMNGEFMINKTHHLTLNTRFINKILNPPMY